MQRREAYRNISISPLCLCVATGKGATASAAWGVAQRFGIGIELLAPAAYSLIKVFFEVGAVF